MHTHFNKKRKKSDVDPIDTTPEKEAKHRKVGTTPNKGFEFEFISDPDKSFDRNKKIQQEQKEKVLQNRKKDEASKNGGKRKSVEHEEEAVGNIDVEDFLAKDFDEVENVKKAEKKTKRKKKRADFCSNVSTDKSELERLIELVETISNHELERIANKETFIENAAKKILKKFLKDVKDYLKEEEKQKIIPNEINEYLRVKENTQEIILRKLKKEEEHWEKIEKNIKDNKFVEDDLLEDFELENIEHDFSLQDKVQDALDQIPMKLDSIAVFTNEIRSLHSKAETLSKKTLNKFQKSTGFGKKFDPRDLLQQLGEE